MAAYYNENDTNAVAWLRQLIKDGLIADGVVDDRSIVDVQPRDLDGYTQHHFFAGIGGWSAALRLAGVPDDEPVATASCPCQPFSCSGLRLGEKDERHLWPELYRLASERRFGVIYGEQVASPDGLEWIDGVSLDLEELGYAVGPFDYPAAGVAAPQLRQRLFWVADAHGERRNGQHPLLREEAGRWNGAATIPEIAGGGETLPWLGGANSGKCEREPIVTRGERNVAQDERDQGDSEPQSSGPIIRLGDPHDPRPQGRGEHRNGGCEWAPWAASVGVCGNDGTWRRLIPGIPPLAPRLPGRLALIRGSGNAIVPQVAGRFIQAHRAATGAGRVMQIVLD